MSTLLIDELYNNVVFEQTIRVLKNVQLAHVRPWIYKHGTLATGNFRLQVYDGATLLKTVDIPYTKFNTEITQPYAHGYITLDVSPLVLNVGTNEEYHDYIFKFSMDGYVTDPNNYIAIVRGWENPIYEIPDATPNDSEDSCGIELYSYKG